MDNEQEEGFGDGFVELRKAEVLYTYLIALKEKNNGTPSGRLWAIAATDCEKLMAWIAYAMVSQ